MYFVVIYTDREGTQDLRADTRPAHLSYVADSGPMVAAGGALLDDAGELPVGSMVILEADNLAQARAWTDHDPYTQAGLFESVMVKPWTWLVNPPKS